MLLQAGIPFQDGLLTIVEETNHAATKQLFQAIADDYELNGDFSAALAKTGVFPTYMVDQLSIAALTGDLQRAMDSLATYYRQEHLIQQSLRHAVRYPLTMASIMLVVLGVLLSQVLPVFAEVFEQMGMQLNGFNSALLAIGTFIGSNIVIIAVVVAVIIAVAVYFVVTDSGKKKTAAFLQKFPATAGLYRRVALARFVGAFAMLINSGIDIDTSLEKVESMTENDSVRKMIADCREKISEGSTTHEALKESGLLSGLYSQIASVGFKSGKVEQAMLEIAKQYNVKVTEGILDRIAIIEPAMVAFFAVIVGVILLSVMMPVFSVLSALG